MTDDLGPDDERPILQFFKRVDGRDALTLRVDLERPDGVHENIVVEVTGFQDPRAAVAALAKLGRNRELIDQLFWMIELDNLGGNE